MVSADEYLSTSYRPDCDYVDGALVERNVGEWDHSRLQAAMGAYLVKRRKQWGVHVLVALRIHVKPSRYRVPDLCVVSASAPREQILTHPPLLCIEILTKDDTKTPM